MSRFYDKDTLKESLTIDSIYSLLEYWGGEPQYSKEGIISTTICHNPPGEGSRKLYYYENTRLFRCYSGCLESSFDIFDLCIKVMRIQRQAEWELYDAMDYIASWFNVDGIEVTDEKDKLKDWDIFKRHDFQINNNREAILKEYNPVILTRFQYPRILSWEKEGISTSVMRESLIGYYSGKNQITIPHYDINGRLVGIRGRYLASEDAERYGKYRPLLIGKQLYSHPLSLNLYNLNKSKKIIAKVKTAILFESEKATMLYRSYYGTDNDISVACCGQSISNYQISLLRDLGAQELIVCFDRDFLSIGDDTFKRLKARLIQLYNRYNSTIRITAIFDKEMILPLKASPLDAGKETFEYLLERRIIPSG